MENTIANLVANNTQKTVHRDFFYKDQTLQKLSSTTVKVTPKAPTAVSGRESKYEIKENLDEIEIEESSSQNEEGDNIWAKQEEEKKSENSNSDSDWESEEGYGDEESEEEEEQSEQSNEKDDGEYDSEEQSISEESTNQNVNYSRRNNENLFDFEQNEELKNQDRIEAEDDILIHQKTMRDQLYQNDKLEDSQVSQSDEFQESSTDMLAHHDNLWKLPPKTQAKILHHEMYESVEVPLKVKLALHDCILEFKDHIEDWECGGKAHFGVCIANKQNGINQQTAFSWSCEFCKLDVCQNCVQAFIYVANTNNLYN